MSPFFLFLSSALRCHRSRHVAQCSTEFESRDQTGTWARLLPQAGRRMTAESRRMAFLLWPGCHPAIMMPALAVLRSANRMAETDHYLVSCYTLDDQPILSAEGWQLPARRWGDAPEALSHLWLVADADRLPGSLSPALVLQLRSLARDGVTLGGLEEGVFPLAMAGLLDGRKCAVHWRMLEEFQERFPM